MRLSQFLAAFGLGAAVCFLALWLVQQPAKPCPDRPVVKPARLLLAVSP